MHVPCGPHTMSQKTLGDDVLTKKRRSNEISDLHAKMEQIQKNRPDSKAENHVPAGNKETQQQVRPLIHTTVKAFVEYDQSFGE
jgi:hypothetical protein